MKDYVIDLHKEAFGQVVRQGVPEQNNMDPNKDIFNGCLVPIKDIPTAAEDPTPKETVGEDDGEEEEEEGDGAGRNDGRLVRFSLFACKPFFCIVSVSNLDSMVVTSNRDVFCYINERF